MKSPYYIFGSDDSEDIDIVVSVPFVPTNQDEASAICKAYESALQPAYEESVDCVIAEFVDGYIVKCNKGTPDELNNCLYYTYGLHEQFFTFPLSGTVTRDTHEKMYRVIRCVLSYHSRIPELRAEIKSALKGNLSEQLAVLAKLDYFKYREFPGKKESLQNIYKILAFQYGQYFAMMQGMESQSYTKKGIASLFSGLRDLLYRKTLNDDHLELLNECNKMFITFVDASLQNLTHQK